MLVLAPPGCGGAPGEDRPSEGPAGEGAAPPDTATLVAAARDVVAFLRGDMPASDIRLADTVALHLAPEGGGERAALPRERLSGRSAWAVRSEASGWTYAFAPPEGLTELTTAVGRHMRCSDQPLASVSAELARLPHVGARLAPPDMMSCLQTWNLTLVFDTAAGPPILVAALYDQWEW
jgi:hypothetical protein